MPEIALALGRWDIRLQGTLCIELLCCFADVSQRMDAAVAAIDRGEDQPSSFEDDGLAVESNKKPHPRLGGRGFVDQTIFSR